MLKTSITMKELTSSVLIILAISVTCVNAQPIKSELTPARGHYKQLEAFSGSAKSADEEIDRQQFITDKETVERRLSLKPIYLQNVTVYDFKIPDVPANSSAKTRAEINYLLALQKYRNEEEVKACLYMADIYYN